MVAPERGLTDADLPGLFEAADLAAQGGQQKFVRAVQLRLVLAVIAAACGVFSWRVGAAGIDLAAIGTAVALAVISLVELHIRSARPVDRWYDGRAIAESAKSIAWRFSVGGAPFAKQGNDDEVRTHFVDTMSRLLAEAPPTGITPSARPVLTDRMSALRAGDLNARKAAYLTFRIGDQHTWYSDKARHNERLAGRWRLALIIIEVLGILAAIARAIGYVDLDAAGVVAALVAAGTAWVNMRQYATLARAYTYAANELAIARRRLERVDDEASWAAEVADSEEAVSREHMMWRASRSHR